MIGVAKQTIAPRLVDVGGSDQPHILTFESHAKYKPLSTFVLFV